MSDKSSKPAGVKKTSSSKGAVPKLPSVNPAVAKLELDKLFDPSKLTTPDVVDDNVSAFCEGVSSYEPFYIECEPELWSRKDCCDLNVEEYIKRHGGQLVAGYKIWYHKPKYIEAERHAVWYKDGVYKDVSFNADGEKRILFLPDEVDKQASLEDNLNKIRWGKSSKVKKLIAYHEQQESRRGSVKAGNDLAGSATLTYGDWLRTR